MLTISTPQSIADDEIEIVCTNSALADFTSNLLKKNVSIQYIMPAGACPSHFDTSPSDVSKIVNADIIISLGWEPWLKSLLNKSDNKAYTEIKCPDLGEWNIPTGAISYVQTISEGLKSALPNQQTNIQENTEEYIAAINTKAAELKNQIITLNLTNRNIVSIEWQKDFLEWLGLNVTYHYSPPERLSLQDEINIMEAASKNSVAAVVDNLQSGTGFGAQVASKNGISHVIFTNFPGAIPNTDTYLDMISYNTDQLINGITSFDQTSAYTEQLQSELNSIQLQRNTLGITTVIAVIICAILFMLYKRK
jgi:ABC-type Zn uptake system ZnuABC Zn-binding protein ZnuA